MVNLRYGELPAWAYGLHDNRLTKAFVEVWDRLPYYVKVTAEYLRPLVIELDGAIADKVLGDKAARLRWRIANGPEPKLEIELLLRTRLSDTHTKYAIAHEFAHLAGQEWALVNVNARVPEQLQYIIDPYEEDKAAAIVWGWGFQDEMKALYRTGTIAPGWWANANESTAVTTEKRLLEMRQQEMA